MTCLFTYTLTVDNLLSSFNYRFWIAVGGTSVPLSPKIMGKKTSCYLFYSRITLAFASEAGAITPF
jgi:hypothetical protein